MTIRQVVVGRVIACEKHALMMLRTGKFVRDHLGDSNYSACDVVGCPGSGGLCFMLTTTHYSDGVLMLNVGKENREQNPREMTVFCLYPH